MLNSHPYAFTVGFFLECSWITSRRNLFGFECYSSCTFAIQSTYGGTAVVSLHSSARGMDAGTIQCLLQVVKLQSICTKLEWLLVLKPS